MINEKQGFKGIKALKGVKGEFLIGVIATSGTLILEVSVFILIISHPRFNQYFNTNTAQGVLGASFGIITLGLIAFGINRLNYYKSRNYIKLRESIAQVEQKYDLIIGQLNNEIAEYRAQISLLAKDESSHSQETRHRYLKMVVELEENAFNYSRDKIYELRHLFETYKIQEE